MDPGVRAERLGNNSIFLTQDERDENARDVLELYKIKRQVFDVIKARMGLVREHTEGCSGEHETEDNGYPMAGGRCLDKDGRLL